MNVLRLGVLCEAEADTEIQKQEVDDDDDDDCPTVSRLLPSTSSDCVTSSTATCDVPHTEDSAVAAHHFVDAYSVAKAAI